MDADDPDARDLVDFYNSILDGGDSEYFHYQRQLEALDRTMTKDGDTPSRCASKDQRIKYN